ncbi:MAG: flagellar type III secretion system pore protein FliP [Kineosporiaceae bacterium]|nr:flagellar type III secretion system pore protein FliP [Kineosporiaceae bacterium]
MARLVRMLLAAAICGGAMVLAAPAAHAGPLTITASATRSIAGPPAISAPAAPTPVPKPSDPTAPSVTADPNITVSVPGQPSRVVQIIVLVTVLGVAPSLLLLCTSFTKIVVVLSLTRSAIGTQTVPPNQVLVGLALFLSLFVMGPTIDAMQDAAVAPYLNGSKTISQAYEAGTPPLRDFMLEHTRDAELALMTKAEGKERPETRDDVGLRTLIPAFVISELRSAFIIGFVIFIPFLVVDLVVSAILMSLGMVMLPPALVSLPFKLLLFVMVDGWSLIVTTLLGTYR